MNLLTIYEQHMPFKHPATDATSKGSMAVKTGVFLTVGMSIPVGMSFYQLYVFCLKVIRAMMLTTSVCCRRKQGGAA